MEEDRRIEGDRLAEFFHEKARRGLRGVYLGLRGPGGWQPKIARQLTLSGYFGCTQGLSVVKAIYPNGGNARMAYLKAMVKS